MALQWQTIQIPFSAGLQQNTDERARLPPALDIAKDVQFDSIMGLQTRYPYVALGSSIFGGGTISNARRLVANGNELVLFTSDSLYSWNAQLSKWILRGTHLAVKVTERAVFGDTADQTMGDRAELNNTIVYAWVEGTAIYAAATDKTTGSVLMAPTVVTQGLTRPRLVALQTKILLFYETGTTNLSVSVIDPATPSTGIGSATAVIANPDFNHYFDVVQIAGTDSAIGACRRTTTTSYSVFKVTSAAAVTASTKARTCDGALAVSCTPDGASVQVIRGNATNVQGDFITISSLADVYTAQAVGTIAAGTTVQVAAAHRSATNGGQYRCYAFWDSGESDGASSVFTTKYNYVDTGNALGTQATFLTGQAPVSRAFDFNGSVYVWIVYSAAGLFEGTGFSNYYGQLQNAYYLYRDDTTLCAKAARSNAGTFSAATGYLPGVAITSGTSTYSWLGLNRAPQLGIGNSFSPVVATAVGRSPQDITFTFDSNEARRTARLGRTLYIASGEVKAYDGVSLVETGFHEYPAYLAGTFGNVAGTVDNGVHTYKQSYRWQNATGEIDRSTSVIVGNVTVAAGPPAQAFIVTATGSLPPTHKTGIYSDIWRTAANPTVEAPYYMVSSLSPTATANPNRSMPTSATTFTDSLADATATTYATFPEEGGVLESIAPPAASIIIASDTRLFLAGISGDPDRIWYSKLRSDGEVAAFNDALTIDIPREGGDVTGLAFLNETLIVFRERAVYAVPGDGFDNLGQGANYGPTKIISLDLGATNHEAIALTPQGLIFKTAKGWYCLDRGWNLSYCGAAVSSYDSETPLAVHVVSARKQVRVLTSARMLVWDYTLPDSPRWAEWTISDGVHAAIWAGTYAYLTATGPKSEQTTYATVDYGMDVETAWIKLNDLQGFARLRKYQAIGEYRSTHHLRFRLAINYTYDGAGNPVYIDDSYWTPYPTTVGNALQVQLAPSRQQIESVKIRITASSTSDNGTPPSGGESLILSGIGLEVGMKQGLYKLLPAAQRR